MQQHTNIIDVKLIVPKVANKKHIIKIDILRNGKMFTITAPHNCHELVYKFNSKQHGWKSAGNELYQILINKLFNL